MTAKSSQQPPLIWLNIAVFSLTFAVAAIAVPYRALTHGFDTFEIVAALLCFIYCGMSITAGYHRLWSHRTYQAHPVLKVIFALGGAFALQNSALHWSSDHRVHHKHVDNNDIDPYSANRGFWYSHIGWMLREYQQHRYHNYDNVRDLQRDAIVMWQHKYYLPLTIAMNFGVPLLLGIWHGDIISSLLLAGFLRLVLSHHTTFFINSLAHIWGARPYTNKNTARDNGILAFFTFGEGYHNFHHLFENDYRNGIRWWQFDPTKWLIKSCSWLKLTWQLRTSPEDKIEKARASMALESSKQLLIRKPNADELLQRLQQDYDLLVARINEFYAAKKQMLELRSKALSENMERSELVKRYQELKQHLLQQRRRWQLTLDYCAA